MNRVIEFRAWDAQTKEMHYPEDRRHDTIKTASAHILKHYDCVMQFTGLLDKNGKKIFEGDICKVYNFDEPNINPYQVAYDRGSFVFKNDLTLSIEIRGYKTDYIEIIGNLYENPDLCN